MKQVLITCAIFFVSLNTHAQTESAALYANKSSIGGNDNDNAATVKNNEFDRVAIATDNGQITFSGLPEEKKAIWAMITNPAGEAIKQKKVSIADNIMDISKLHNGMYFVTLVYGNASKKGFVIHVEKS